MCTVKEFSLSLTSFVIRRQGQGRLLFTKTTEVFLVQVFPGGRTYTRTKFLCVKTGITSFAFGTRILAKEKLSNFLPVLAHEQIKVAMKENLSGKTCPPERGLKRRYKSCTIAGHIVADMEPYTLHYLALGVKTDVREIPHAYVVAISICFRVAKLSHNEFKVNTSFQASFRYLH